MSTHERRERRTAPAIPVAAGRFAASDHDAAGAGKRDDAVPTAASLLHGNVLSRMSLRSPERQAGSADQTGAHPAPAAAGVMQRATSLRVSDGPGMGESVRSSTATSADAPTTARDDTGEVMPEQSGERRENRTGMPDALKDGVESLSGLALDEVRVHYGSAKPAAVGAYAYAQGTEIHLGPGQERHLPHEAWHVVQQKQGRVKPTLQAKGLPVNDDAGLEAEADTMGARAAGSVTPGGAIFRHARATGEAVIQRAYVNGSAAADFALFERLPAPDEAIDLTAPTVAPKATALGITSTNLKHYLQRHTFKYQPLNGASTDADLTGMFPSGTDKDGVKDMVLEAITKVPDGTVIEKKPVSVGVDLASGLRVNLGALDAGKLRAFFPLSGTGVHSYTRAELQAIKAEKNAQATGSSAPSGGTTP